MAGRPGRLAGWQAGWLAGWEGGRAGRAGRLMKVGGWWRRMEEVGVEEEDGGGGRMVEGDGGCWRMDEDGGGGQAGRLMVEAEADGAKHCVLPWLMSKSIEKHCVFEIWH